MGAGGVRMGLLLPVEVGGTGMGPMAAGLDEWLWGGIGGDGVGKWQLDDGDGIEVGLGAPR